MLIKLITTLKFNDFGFSHFPNFQNRNENNKKEKCPVERKSTKYLEQPLDKCTQLPWIKTPEGGTFILVNMAMWNIYIYIKKKRLDLPNKSKA